jgi:hypothetical protein
MPIRDSEKARYPKDWPQISQRIRERANGCCEFCGIKNYSLGGRTKDGKWLAARPLGEKGLHLEWPQPGELAWCGNGETEGQARLKIVRIVLTVAHLDHTPENCADENLKALCQRCHLVYDAKHHARNAAETRRQKMGCGDMFEEARSMTGNVLNAESGE